MFRSFTVALAAILAASYIRAATITVTGTGDAIAVDGAVTLREAITSINNGARVNADVVAAGAYGTNDQIAFAIPGSGVHTIAPTSALPAISRPMTIDGYTQPGSSPNSLANGDDAVILIELDGSSAGSSSGLTVTAGNSNVKGLAIGDFLSGGVELITAGGNTVSGNFLGTDYTGAVARGNHFGVIIKSAGNTIGGLTPPTRNVVSGNQVGVLVAGASGTGVFGNFIGTDGTGTVAIPSVKLFSGACSAGGWNGTWMNISCMSGPASASSLRHTSDVSARLVRPAGTGRLAS